jgi:flagellar biosynthesis/type III secretory pathway M-ring protein FliF/YscJ
MVYVWAVILIVVLFLVWQIARWVNLPQTIEERRKAQESRSKAWSDWRAQRPRLFKRLSPPKLPVDPTPEKKDDKIELPVKPVVSEKPRRRRKKET